VDDCHGDSYTIPIGELRKSDSLCFLSEPSLNGVGVLVDPNGMSSIGAFVRVYFGVSQDP
jgi:hypothetical protein